MTTTDQPTSPTPAPEPAPFVPSPSQAARSAVKAGEPIPASLWWLNNPAKVDAALRSALAATAPQTAPSKAAEAGFSANWEGVPVTRGRMGPSATTTLTLDNSSSPHAPTPADPGPVRETAAEGDPVAVKIWRDWMAHLGFTEEQTARLDAPVVHTDDCQRVEFGWDCTDENGREIHPGWTEANYVDELIMFVLEHPALAARTAGDEHLQALRDGLAERQIAPPRPGAEVTTLLGLYDAAKRDLAEARREADRLRGEVGKIAEGLAESGLVGGPEWAATIRAVLDAGISDTTGGENHG